jgi:hypothetical protein
MLAQKIFQLRLEARVPAEDRGPCAALQSRRLDEVLKAAIDKGQ